jgi:hypothetical protein
MANPIPVAVGLQTPSFAAVIMWNLLYEDSWRRETAQAWITHDLYKVLYIINILYST